MKKLTCLLFVLCLALGLSACGCDGGADADLVFVNDSDAVVVTVLAKFADQASGTGHADSSPMKKGETFGFKAGQYPVTVLVYDKFVGSSAETEKELARLTIDKAPPAEGRWYVTARDGGAGLILTVDTSWP